MIIVGRYIKDDDFKEYLLDPLCKEPMKFGNIKQAKSYLKEIGKTDLEIELYIFEEVKNCIGRREFPLSICLTCPIDECRKNSELRLEAIMESARTHDK